VEAEEWEKVECRWRLRRRKRDGGGREASR